MRAFPARKHATMTVSSHSSRCAWLTADAHNVSQQRLYSIDNISVVTLREGLDATTEGNEKATRPKLTRNVKRFEVHHASVKLSAIPGSCRDKCVVKVCKMIAGVRKGHRPIGGELAPRRLKAGFQFK